MNTELIMQYASYLLIAIGGIAFVVSIITQAIKEMPGLKNIQTNAVALVLSLILCPAVLVALCQWKNTPITWYTVVASFIVAFIVYLVSTGGWEKVREMWLRTKYNKNGKNSEDGKYGNI